MLDGSAAKGEKHLWQACCERAGPNIAQFSEARVMYTARFKSTHGAREPMAERCPNECGLHLE